MSKLLLLFALLAVSSAVSFTDYCHVPGICQGDLIHVTCGATGKLSFNCAAGTKFENLTFMIEDILTYHNEKRNLIAGGQIPGFLPAVRMATMGWDDELAEMAALNVETCVYAHDECRNTYTFKYSGQNIGQPAWIGPEPTINSVISEQIDAWFDEYKETDMDNINTLSDLNSAHFTLMVTEPNIRVGCAAIRSEETDTDSRVWQTLTFTCNYAYTNIAGQKVYRSGPATSQCVTGTNPQYEFLCSTNEVYDYNDILP